MNLQSVGLPGGLYAQTETIFMFNSNSVFDGFDQIINRPSKSALMAMPARSQ